MNSLENKCRYNPLVEKPLIAVRIRRDRLNFIDVEKKSLVLIESAIPDPNGYCNNNFCFEGVANCLIDTIRCVLDRLES